MLNLAVDVSNASCIYGLFVAVEGKLLPEPMASDQTETSIEWLSQSVVSSFVMVLLLDHKVPGNLRGV